MYIITKEFTMDCCHRLVGYQGDCANWHGHTYRIIVEIASEELDELGMVVDFSKIKKMVHGKYDHMNINDCPEFELADGGVNPTAENMARIIWETIQIYCSGLPHKPKCLSVTVYETASSRAVYKP